MGRVKHGSTYIISLLTLRQTRISDLEGECGSAGCVISLIEKSKCHKEQSTRVCRDSASVPNSYSTLPSAHGRLRLDTETAVHHHFRQSQSCLPCVRRVSSAFAIVQVSSFDAIRKTSCRLLYCRCQPMPMSSRRCLCQRRCRISANRSVTAAALKIFA